jgi:hypothetical protein
MDVHRAIYWVSVTAVRSATVAAFVAQLAAVAAMAGDLDRAEWRRLGLGFRFWMGLGNECALLALVCLAGCGVLAVVCPVDITGLPRLWWCPWLSVATIAMLMLIPDLCII